MFPTILPHLWIGNNIAWPSDSWLQTRYHVQVLSQCIFRLVEDTAYEPVVYRTSSW